MQSFTTERGKESALSKLEKLFAKRCDNCPLCNYARKNPETTVGKIIHWHGKWCPFWKAWQKEYGDQPAAE